MKQAASATAPNSKATPANVSGSVAVTPKSKLVITRASAGYYNFTHEAAPLQLVDAFAGEPDLNWNLAVGMQRPDDALRQQVDAALEALLADGTIARIYGRYGVAALPP